MQGAAEVVGQADAGRLVHAEDADRQPADGAGDAVAIEIEDVIGRRDDIGVHIHLHAVDHRQKVVLAQAEAAHRLGQEAREAGGLAGIEGGEIGAPRVELAAALRLVDAGLVGDVIHLAAEGVDVEHGRTLGRRQHPHGGVERAAGRLFFGGGGRFGYGAGGGVCEAHGAPLWPSLAVLPRLKRETAKAPRPITPRPAISSLL